jgi:hypothetical protein
MIADIQARLDGFFVLTAVPIASPLMRDAASRFPEVDAIRDMTASAFARSPLARMVLVIL